MCVAKSLSRNVVCDDQVTSPLSHSSGTPSGVQTFPARPPADKPVACRAVLFMFLINVFGFFSQPKQIGDNVENFAGARQTTGEAVYVDDVPPTPNELQARRFGRSVDRCRW